MTSETKLKISMFLKVNYYAGKCIGCDAHVEPLDAFVQREGGQAAAQYRIVCEACVRAHGRAVPVRVLRGDGVEILTGSSVSTKKTHDVLACVKCGREVAYVKGTKGWYLANVQRKQSDEGTSSERRVYDFKAHTKKECEKVVTDYSDLEAEPDVERIASRSFRGSKAVIEAAMPDGRVAHVGGNRAARAAVVLVQEHPSKGWGILGCRADAEAAKLEAERLSADHIERSRGMVFEVAAVPTFVYPVRDADSDEIITTLPPTGSGLL